jgi:hypothetical protein
VCSCKQQEISTRSAERNIEGLADQCYTHGDNQRPSS